jgi:indole-3-glycerol phosphate synthase
MTILDQIVAAKRREVADAQASLPLSRLRGMAAQAPPPRDFFAALAAPGGIKLIAEVKRASPSRGVLREPFDPLAIARTYAAHGAACISVLTDERWFQGSLEHLRAIRGAVDLPVLRKDFILDPYQVWQARAAGADAVLLIAECLDDCGLRSLHNLTCELGMTPLVEIYDPANLPRALEAGTRLLGINNRNLHTFETRLDHTLELLSHVPGDCLVVSESGIRTRQDVLRLEAAGVRALLVGETLVTQPDPGAAIDALLGRR